MADVKIRKLDDWVVEAHRNRAKAAGHSLEEELRRLLTEAAEQRRLEAVRSVDEFREKLRKEYGTLSDSTELIRQDRDERG